jgi:hypothetical protein
MPPALRGGRRGRDAAAARRDAAATRRRAKGALALSDLHRPIDVNAAVIALLLSVLWGANPVAIKLGLKDAPPLRLACSPARSSWESAPSSLAVAVGIGLTTR